MGSAPRKSASRRKSSPVPKDKLAPKGKKVLKRKVALSDDELSDNPVAMPLHGRKWTAFAEREEEDHFDDDAEKPMPTAENGDADDVDEEEEEEEEDLEADDIFVVEKILAHMVDKDGGLMFKVKWEGYSKKSDQTWEPEDSLREGAESILESYLAEQGGRDQIIEDTQEAVTTKKRGRKSAADGEPKKRAKRNGHPADTVAPATGGKAGAWQPPAGSWEDHIESIDACEDESTGKLVVFLNWKNGKKTKHNTEVVYRRCPQKMLRFYENHVRIVKNETAEGLDIEDMEDAVRDTEAKARA
ncbi:related to chromatin-associated swi6 protein [Cephalotrichum gorgonifer]|uniref:Related to chromatin-associated swi6 protein n=1 Tax=Cephalotrichum gorgonifer TaxID=2041049 RepID=A0AAE8N1Z9_9PEZI|nr:related to chromatin-associated swi6 protein [Cephalotrichum gorgonifer]